ncbi:MAG TPA: 4-hydroxythreonine-4-phosphate dehydrogenase PdxA, partial [Niastella sp.]|nr:4-hydroxythreonine-4-phosphate dehydrogenase PdxA [Niastella sp.]
MIKPVIGISCGDLNGIGPEIIIKTLSDHRILEYCTPVIFGSGKLIAFYRKIMPDMSFNYQIINGFAKLNPKQINVLQCWEEDVAITPGQLNETGGRYAVRSLQAAMQALKEGHLHGLVTAPIHKS